MSLFGKKPESSSVVGNKGINSGQPALVHKEVNGAIVLLRSSIVDACRASGPDQCTVLGLEGLVASMAGRFAGIGTQQGYLLYKSGNVSVKHLRSGKDALSGKDLSDWDEPCYLVMFRER